MIAFLVMESPNCSIENILAGFPKTTINLWLRYQIVVPAILCLLSIAIIVVFFVRFKRFHRLLAAEITSQQIKLELAIQIRKIISVKLAEDIRHCEEQMLAFNKTLAKRQQVQESIKIDLERLKKESPQAVTRKLDELKTQIKECADEREDDWKKFEFFFDNVYPQFLENFANAFPELKDTEIRLCALLKLNLETKQIASVLNLTNEGAKVAKYRLRKKLRLSPDENLIAFFNSI
jgi:DNA-binding CsgD family transcriptional regulator